jgi:hypothetical protein
MIADCQSFQTAHADLLSQWYDVVGETPEHAGYDFWLTRNGHGAGFWDRWSDGGVNEALGHKLSDACEPFGSCDLYVGDDERIYSL